MTPTRAAAAIAECRLIATMTEEPGRTTRRFLTPPMSQVHMHLRSRMEALGMTVSTDAAGNLRGLVNSSANPNSKRLILGSHVDTVPNAGPFDGVLGVVLALFLIEAVKEHPLPYPIEIIAFSEEEGVRFGVPFLGSRAVANFFDPALLDLRDSADISVAQAIQNFGLDPTRIHEAVAHDAIGYFEIHIEQGPVLDSENLPLGIVTAIVGQTRSEITFTGHANHAGTTPISLRHDALAAAAQWITQVEQIATTDRSGLVATVGKLQIEPNTSNVIPAQVKATLDLRHEKDQIRLEAATTIHQAAKSIVQARNLTCEIKPILNQPATPMDPTLTAALTASIQQAGHPIRHLPSGAGHDAMIMATRMPTAMLFLRSPAGLSHHPQESVLESDIEAALQTATLFLHQLAAATR